MAEIRPLSSDDLLQLEAKPAALPGAPPPASAGPQLRCLRPSPASAGAGSSPTATESWLASQDSLYNDPAFAQAFLDQLQSARLPALSKDRRTAGSRFRWGWSLSDLCQWADAQARARVSPPAAALPAPPQTDASEASQGRPTKPRTLDRGLSHPAAPGARPSPVPCEQRHRPSRPVRLCKAAC